ncbi:MAG: hypothetical protein HYW77_02680 [Parcubacteria group bacterium]|nr:hypothetical protein [Parcubacteria group bacterium]
MELDQVIAEFTAQKKNIKSDNSKLVWYLILAIFIFLFLVYFKVPYSPIFGNRNSNVSLVFNFGDHTREFQRELEQPVSVLGAIIEATTINKIQFGFTDESGKITIVKLNNVLDNHGRSWRVYVNGEVISGGLLDKHMLNPGDLIEVRLEQNSMFLY